MFSPSHFQGIVARLDTRRDAKIHHRGVTEEDSLHLLMTAVKKNIWDLVGLFLQ